jgi:hypothetical protein
MRLEDLEQENFKPGSCALLRMTDNNIEQPIDDDCDEPSAN